ncbi:hypothetical protein BSKO_09623 [Bryopsis sp. KO-2023]|nr:hypothetical protein BSKO_09623 [Bryopsis sp. KO-2023]
MRLGENRREGKNLARGGGGEEAVVSGVMDKLYVNNFSEIEKIMEECVLQSGLETLQPACVEFLQELKAVVAPPRKDQTDQETQEEIRLKREIEELRKHVLASRSTIPADLSEAVKRNIENCINESGVDTTSGADEETTDEDLKRKIESLNSMLQYEGGNTASKESWTLKLKSSLVEHKAALDRLQKVRNLFQSDVDSMDTGPLSFDRPLIANTPIVKANLATAAQALNR